MSLVRLAGAGGSSARSCGRGRPLKWFMRIQEGAGRAGGAGTGAAAVAAATTGAASGAVPGAGAVAWATMAMSTRADAAGSERITAAGFLRGRKPRILTE